MAEQGWMRSGTYRYPTRMCCRTRTTLAKLMRQMVGNTLVSLIVHRYGWKGTHEDIEDLIPPQNLHDTEIEDPLLLTVLPARKQRQDEDDVVEYGGGDEGEGEEGGGGVEVTGVYRCSKGVGRDRQVDSWGT